MQIPVRYENGCLVPYTPQNAEELAKKLKGKEGEMIGIELITHRNYGNLQRLFTFIEAVFEMQEHYPSKEHLRIALTVKAGWCDVVISHKGETSYQAKSISYKSIPDEDDFKPFFKRFRDAAFLMLQEMGRNLTDEEFNRLTSYD